MNLFDLPRQLPPEELTETLLDSHALRIERIVSTGQTSDWYDQKEDEYIVLLQGLAELEYDDGTTLRVKAGDTLLIPAHKKHRVSYTSEQPPCIWLCMFYSGINSKQSLLF